MTQGAMNLGNAQGKILIDTSDLQRIQALTQQVGQTVARNLGQIDQGAKAAQQGLGSLSDTLGDISNAFGGFMRAIGLIQQGGSAILQADALATAFRRQGVAAVSLAGGQAKLNALMAEYAETTGNAIDEATALGDITRLQAVGFADNTKELEEFVTAARGISVAMGSQIDYITGQLQLAIANESTMRLDQLGLGVDEVTTKVERLKAADSSLSGQQAYQNAILSIAIEKYGALATSAEAQATGAEKAAKAWKELQLQLGEDAGSTVGKIMEQLAKEIDAIAQKFRDLAGDIQLAKDALSDQGWTMPEWLKAIYQFDPIEAGANAAQDSMRAYLRNPEAPGLRNQIATREGALTMLYQGLERLPNDPNTTQADIDRQKELIRQVNVELAALRLQLNATTAAAGNTQNNYAALPGGMYPFPSKATAAPGPRFNKDQTTAIQKWAADVQQIEREAGTARVDATRQYEQQRAEAITSYGRQIAREEADFARSRAKAVRDYNRQIEEAQADAVKREAEAIRTYNKAVADAQQDAAKREAKWLEDYNERVAELRADGNERLTELEEKYNKDRERAADDHRERLLDAAARLDAVAVRNEQRAYERQQQEAAENYNEQRQKLTESLAEQLADAQKAYDERLADAREADAERLAEMKEAQDERLQAAREADAERLADMKRSFEERIAQEDEERAIANQRRAEDHAAQMAQMEAAQADRMAQIDRQEAAQKAALDESFLKQLEGLSIHNKTWLELQKERQRDSLKLFDEWLKEIEKSLIAQLPPMEGPAGQRITTFAGFDETRRQLANEMMFTPTQQAAAGGSVSNRSITIAEGAIVINAAPEQDERDVARQVRTEMERLLEEAGR